MLPKTVKKSTSACVDPTKPRVGRHLDSVFMHYKHCIISVLSFTPTCSKKKHANTIPTCMHAPNTWHAHMQDRTDLANDFGQAGRVAA